MPLARGGVHALRAIIDDRVATAESTGPLTNIEPEDELADLLVWALEIADREGLPAVEGELEDRLSPMALNPIRLIAGGVEQWRLDDLFSIPDLPFTVGDDAAVFDDDEDMFGGDDDEQTLKSLAAAIMHASVDSERGRRAAEREHYAQTAAALSQIVSDRVGTTDVQIRPEEALDVARRVFPGGPSELAAYMDEIARDDKERELRDCDQEVLEKITRNMSKRAASLLIEDMDYMGAKRWVDRYRPSTRCLGLQ